MTRDDLKYFGLPASHVLSLWKVINNHKDSTIIPTNDLDLLTPSTPASSSYSRPPNAPSVRRSPRLAEAALQGATPPRGKVVPSKRHLHLADVEEHVSPSKKNAKASKYPQYSHLHSRCGDGAYVRIHVRDSLCDQATLKSVLDKGTASHSELNRMVDILLNKIFSLIKTWYPHRDAKVQLAKDIVKTFPKVKAVCGEPESTFFNGSTGIIQHRLNELRKVKGVRKRQTGSAKGAETNDGKKQSVPSKKGQSKKPRAERSTKWKSASDVTNLPEDVQVKIMNLSCLLETPDNKQKIVAGMKELETLRLEMNQSLDPLAMFQIFPHLLSFNGQLIDADFRAMKGPIGESFLGSFKALYEKNILKYVELYAPQINDQLPQFQSDTLKALVALVAIAPRFPIQNYGDDDEEIQGKKGRAKSKGKGNGEGRRGQEKVNPRNYKHPFNKLPHPALLQVIEDNSSVEDYTSIFFRTNSDGDKEVQPYILALNNPTGSPQYYLKADWKTIHVGSCPLQALALLVKFCYFFDRSYDIDLKHLYVFIEYVFGLSSGDLNCTMDTFVRRLKSL